jgi:hypothetical protein
MGHRPLLNLNVIPLLLFVVVDLLPNGWNNRSKIYYRGDMTLIGDKSMPRVE